MQTRCVVGRHGPKLSPRARDHKMMKILLSGGWGYGNLGDDAILATTVKLLRQEYPKASITVMTYDCDATRSALRDPDIDVVPSIHRYLIGNLSLKRFRPLCNGSSLPRSITPTFARRVRSKLKSEANKRYRSLAEGLSYYKYRWLSRYPGGLRASSGFDSADLFVMSGGAYLNSEWPDSVYAHALELRLAHQCGVKSVLVGQSIGPISNEKVKAIAYQAIRLASQVSVRDVQSYDELRHGGIDCSQLPDLALADVDFDFDRLPEIAVVVNDDLSLAAQEQIGQAVVQFCRDRDLTVKGLVTRRWWPDVRRARMFYDMLESANVRAKLVVPDDHITLQREIGTSRLVLSPNLHGLILGWRAGVPCISLQGRRKDIAFMKQTHQNQRALASNHMSVHKVVSTMCDALQAPSGFREERETISREIVSRFSAMVAV